LENSKFIKDGLDEALYWDRIPAHSRVAAPISKTTRDPNNEIQQFLIFHFIQAHGTNMPSSSWGC
jgi:hypothetical protein